MAKFLGNLKDIKGKSVQQTMVAVTVKEARDTWRIKALLFKTSKR